MIAFRSAAHVGQTYTVMFRWNHVRCADKARIRLSRHRHLIAIAVDQRFLTGGMVGKKIVKVNVAKTDTCSMQTDQRVYDGVKKTDHMMTV